VEDIDESYHVSGEDENTDDSSSDEECAGTDAVARLLATFNTNSCKAVGSDEDEEDDDDDDEEEEEDGAEEEEEVTDVTDEGSDANGDTEHAESEIENDIVAGEKNMESYAGQDTDTSNDDDDDDAESLGEMQNVNDSTAALDEEEGEDSSQSQGDPFSLHFERNLSETAAEQIKDTKSWISNFNEWPTLGRIKVEVPNVEVKIPKLLLLAEENQSSSMPNIAVIPQPPEKKNFNLDKFYIRKALQKNILSANISGSCECPTSLTDLQKELLSVLSSYCDMYYPQATHENWEEVRTVYALHAINHILKTRKKIVNHSAKITKAKSEKRYEDSDNYRDQGYSRPRGKAVTIQNQNRFREDFGPGDEEGKDSVSKLNRPEDFQETFKGDISEDFKIGLKLTKSSLKLYADFYNSDIIIASPLGLRYVMGNSSNTGADSDFLTSIEILIMDQADVFMMQNWEHVLVLMETVNKPPRDIHKLDVDLTRVRLWSLDGHSPLYRQTVLFSSTHIDHNRALISKCTNLTGRLQVLNPVDNGSVQEVVVQAELVLHRIAGMRDPDSRFRFFTQEIFPQLRSSMRSHTMVYIPDYCDYVRLVRYLKEDGGTSIATINEYMVGQNSKVAKARSLFFDGKRQFLLYTERFHFYRRYRIKGIRHIIFYDLPSYPHFFSEICNLMVEANQNPRTRQKHLGTSTVTVLFQRTDLTKLIGILGSKRASEVINSTKIVHLCVIGK
ncbi:Digestive organ expansion factor-like, partial [Homarus americanus]